MIITCPACDAQYLLPDEAIGSSGRRVKCTTCDNAWVQSPAPEILVEAEEEKHVTFPANERKTDWRASASKMEDASLVPVAGNKLRIFAGALGVAGALLALTMGFGLLFRQVLIGYWPQSAMLYASVGLKPALPGTGLVFQDVAAKIETAAEKNLVMAVSGKISNTTKTAILLPDLMISLSQGNKPVKEWPIELHGRALHGGKTVTFDYHLKNSPADGNNLNLRFSD